MLYRRRLTRSFGLVVCLLAGSFFYLPLSAQPAAEPAETQELLELPSFVPPSAPTPQKTIKLQLLPGETASMPAVAPAPETAAAPITTPPAPMPEPVPAPAIAAAPPATVQYAEEMGPPMPPATALAQPLPAALPAEPAPTTLAGTEPYGPPAPPATTTAAPASPAVADAPALALTPAAPQQLAVIDDFIGPRLPAALPTTSPPLTAEGTPPASAEAATPPVKTAKAAIPYTGEDMLQDGWDEGSVMFSPEEIELLQEALFAAKNGPEEIVLPEGLPAPETPAVPPTDYAAFYVNSILYFSPDHWMVWINGKKFFSGKDSPLERLTVKHVGSRTVTFVWEPVSKKHPLADLTTSNKNVTVLPDGNVELTMAANQTFLVPNMRLLEGRGMTAQVRELLALNAAAAKAAEEAAAQAAAGAKAGATPIAAMKALPPEPAINPNRDRQNVDKLISQYRQMGNAMPNPTGGNTLPPTP